MTEAQARPKPPNFLEIHSASKPDKLATIGPDRALTYGQLRERSRALAKRMYRMGLRPGDQVAVMTYNLPESAEIANAVHYLQVGLVMVGYRMKPREIEFIADNSDSKMVFFWHEFAERILPFKGNYRKVMPQGFVSFGGSVEGALEYGISSWVRPRSTWTTSRRPSRLEATLSIPPGRPAGPRARLAVRISRPSRGSWITSSRPSVF